MMHTMPEAAQVPEFRPSIVSTVSTNTSSVLTPHRER